MDKNGQMSLFDVSCEESVFDDKGNESTEEFYESLCYSYEQLMALLAEPIIKRLVCSVRRRLQSLKRESNMMLWGEDSGLKNFWDEICVQVQGEESIFFDMYIDTIEEIIEEFLSKRTEEEKIILWTQTEEYEEWKTDEHKEKAYSDVLCQYVNEDDIRNYVFQEVICEAANYHTDRIECFLCPGE